jgi:hypothetical protein
MKEQSMWKLKDVTPWHPKEFSLPQPLLLEFQIKQQE